MKIEDVEVGDTIIALDDGENYTMTTKDNEWIGKIIAINKYYFKAKTISCINGSTQLYTNLDPEYFIKKWD